MKHNIGVFLSRMQPLHIGHLGIIEKAISENDKVVVLIGSKNKNGTLRNPFDVKLRREILEDALLEKFGHEYKNKIFISELPDWSMETEVETFLEWGRYLYYNIVSIAEQKEFSIYFSDEPKLIKSWFEKELQDRIIFRLFERNNMFDAVSSTKIRQAFIDEDKEYIQKSCPNAVVKRYDELRKILKKVNENPKEDYTI